MVLVRSRRPRGKRFNLTILWYLHRYRRFYLGTYYFPEVSDMLPVLDVPKDVELPKRFFERIDRGALERAYRMVCLGSCGACCEVAAGSFVFEDEIRELGLEEVPIDGCEEVVLLNGVKTRVCPVPMDSGGRCVFYDASSRRCLIHDRKPIICVVSYCSLVALRNGVLHYRVRASGGRVVYRPWRGSIDELVELVRASVLSYARRYLARAWKIPSDFAND